MIVVSDKIWAFELKLVFGETSINHCQFDSLSIQKIFSNEIDGEINEVSFHNEKCQHLKCLHNSMQQWATDAYNSQSASYTNGIQFKYEKLIDMVSNSTL